jgi:hypothetical protein
MAKHLFQGKSARHTRRELRFGPVYHEPGPEGRDPTLPVNWSDLERPVLHSHMVWDRRNAAFEPANTAARAHRRQAARTCPPADGNDTNRRTWGQEREACVRAFRRPGRGPMRAPPAGPIRCGSGQIPNRRSRPAGQPRMPAPLPPPLAPGAQAPERRAVGAGRPGTRPKERGGEPRRPPGTQDRSQALKVCRLEPQSRAIVPAVMPPAALIPRPRSAREQQRAPLSCRSSTTACVAMWMVSNRRGCRPRPSGQPLVGVDPRLSTGFHWQADAR